MAPRAAALLLLALALPSAPFAIRAPPRMMAGAASKRKGFGAPPKPSKKDARKAQQRETRVASLDAHAARLLAKANGDVDQAQNAHFEAGLRALQENEPALFAQVVELQRTTPADIDSEGAAHAKLVELVWDSVAAYIPLGDAPAAAAAGPVGAKLRLVARACAAGAGGGGGDGATAAVLDVGCGDGSLVPYLLDAEADAARYLGIDVAGGMVAAARAAHPSAAFSRLGLFDGDAPPAPPPGDAAAAGFDAVVFNGSFQFFADARAALLRARAALRPGPGARIVLAHANGAAFVRTEVATSPALAISPMPAVAWLEDEAPALGMRVLGPAALGSAESLDDFYLAALEVLE